MTARDILLDVRLAHLPLWMITSWERALGVFVS